ncbi:MAG: hypothetical protein GF409_01410 [Candidatus Omnitrophica bacterium]|nr:hypothetical protein [Candidatus Omnitrophota bacterium]
MKSFLATLLCLVIVFLPEGSKAGEVLSYTRSLSDKELISLIASVNNTHPDAWEDKVAREVTLEKLLSLSKKRRSDEISASGILEYRYRHIDLDDWPGERLRELYKLLRMKQRKIDWNTFEHTVPRERALLYMREMTKEAVAGLIMHEPEQDHGFYGSWWS